MGPNEPDPHGSTTWDYEPKSKEFTQFSFNNGPSFRLASFVVGDYIAQLDPPVPELPARTTNLYSFKSNEMFYYLKLIVKLH